MTRSKLTCHPDRRGIVIAGAAVLVAATLPAGVLHAAEPGLAPAADFLDRVRRLLSMLEPDKRKAASFVWDGEAWRGWNYFGFTGYNKPGLRLEQMSPAQKSAAWELLAVILSPIGIEKARNVMALQDVLAESGNGTGQRSSEKFSMSVFGAPAETGAWGFRFEGHHLTLSLAVRDNRIVSVTPSSFSANPNRVVAGSRSGLVTLKGEEQIARRLARDLQPKLLARAKLSDRPLDNILSASGRERANAKKAGLPAADMTVGQRDVLSSLIETYAVEHLAPALATAQRARLRNGDGSATHFAWYGPNAPERAFGYRVIGDGFVIEMGSVDPAAQHLHTIYHDLGNVLGRT